MNRIKVTQIGSSFGRKPGHKACVTGLGLRRRHHTVELEDTPAVRGMIKKVAYLLKVQEL
jgi:large subunit ribosomal protein L30